jgi:hypothetical protein
MSYRSYTLQELKSSLGKRTKVFIKESGKGKLLFTSHGARLLGMFPNPKLPNVLWVHKNLDALLKKGNWMIGGDRLWLAPERNFYYENPRDFIGFHIPAGIDPGTYATKDGLHFQNTFSLIDYTHNILADNMVMKRSFEIIKDPYKTNLAYAGVRCKESVRVPFTDIKLALWSITQTYTCGKSKPGTGLFPIKNKGEILSYFDRIPSTFAQVKDGYIRFKLESTRIYKLAIAPEDVVFGNPCKDIYVSPYPKGNQWFAVVKRSNDLPKSQSECVDVARANPEGPKGAIQSYNNGPGFGEEKDAPPFAEIELQLTKAKKNGKHLEASATHELLTYAGSKQQILELAGELLQIRELPVVY